MVREKLSTIKGGINSKELSKKADQWEETLLFTILKTIHSNSRHKLSMILNWRQKSLTQIKSIMKVNSIKRPSYLKEMEGWIILMATIMKENGKMANFMEMEDLLGKMDHIIMESMLKEWKKVKEGFHIHQESIMKVTGTVVVNMEMAECVILLKMWFRKVLGRMDIMLKADNHIKYI